MAGQKPDTATLLRRSERVLTGVIDRLAVITNGVNVRRLRGNIRSWLKENPTQPAAKGGDK